MIAECLRYEYWFEGPEKSGPFFGQYGVDYSARIIRRGHDGRSTMVAERLQCEILHGAEILSKGESWPALGYIRLCVEAVLMSDRKRGPVTPPAAAVNWIYQSDEGKQPRRNCWADQASLLLFHGRRPRSLIRLPREWKAENSLGATFMHERIIRGGERHPP